MPPYRVEVGVFFPFQNPNDGTEEGIRPEGRNRFGHHGPKLGLEGVVEESHVAGLPG